MTSIDPADVLDTNMILTIQNATQVFNETQKFPEKDAYTIIKQITCIVMMIILAIEIKCVNKVTLAYAHIDNLHYWAVIVYACIYPIGLYVCDYIHSVLTAK